MSEHHHHHHHHHRKDDASRFKERSLRSIVLRRQVEKWAKVIVFIIAILMVAAVIASLFIK